MKDRTYYKRIFKCIPDDVIEMSRTGKTYKMIYEEDSRHKWIYCPNATPQLTSENTLHGQFVKYDSKEEMLADMFMELI